MVVRQQQAGGYRAGAGKPRVYRAPDDLYERAQFVAHQRGENLSEKIRDFLAEYVGPRPTARRHPGRRADDRAMPTVVDGGRQSA